MSTLLAYALPIAVLSGIAVLYERQARAGGDSDRPRGIQRPLFYAGLVVLGIALATPMRTIADRELFSVHAVQHVLLTLAAPPLLIAGLTAAMVRPLAGPVLGALTPATSDPKASAALTTIAFVLLEIAFLRSDFSFKVVAEHSSLTTPTFYKASASWSSQEGSLLLWLLLLSVGFLSTIPTALVFFGLSSDSQSIFQGIALVDSRSVL